MEYANGTFEAIQLLLDTLVQIDNCSTQFVNQNPPDGEVANRFREYLSDPTVLSLSGANSQMLTNLTNSLFKIGSPNNIWNLTEELHENVLMLEEASNLIDWDVFYPVESEEEMVRISFDKDLQKELGMSSVFAGSL